MGGGVREGRWILSERMLKNSPAGEEEECRRFGKDGKKQGRNE